MDDDLRRRLLNAGTLRPLGAADIAPLDVEPREPASPLLRALFAFHAHDTPETEAALRQAHRAAYADDPPETIDTIIANLREPSQR